MNDLAALLSSFNVKVLFDVTRSLADAVAMYISPVLLLIAIYIRLMETQVDALVSGGKYGVALRDMILWSVVLGSYYAIGAYVIGIFNPVYAWLDSFASLKSTMSAFAAMMARNKVAADTAGLTFMGVMTTPYALMAMLLYYTTLVVLAFLTAFLKIAHAMVFGVAFIWGLIAIPISISTTLRILRGWAYLCAFVLAWPVVQGLVMAMFAMLFTTSSELLMASADSDTTLRAANIMILFSVMHLLLGAVMVAAPFITNALVTNASAAASIVMPFVAAATTAGVATARGFTGRTGRGAREGARPAPSDARPVPQGIHTRPTARNTAPPAPEGAVGTPSAPASAGPGSTGAPSPAQDPGRKRQQRRGVVIRQQANRKKVA